MQHYKSELTAEQKQLLKVLLRSQPHAQITPEVRRELFCSRSRGDPFLPSLAGGDGGGGMEVDDEEAHENML